MTTALLLSSKVTTWVCIFGDAGPALDEMGINNNNCFYYSINQKYFDTAERQIPTSFLMNNPEDIQRENSWPIDYADRMEYVYDLLLFTRFIHRVSYGLLLPDRLFNNNQHKFFYNILEEYIDAIPNDTLYKGKTRLLNNDDILREMNGSFPEGGIVKRMMKIAYLSQNIEDAYGEMIKSFHVRRTTNKTSDVIDMMRSIMRNMEGLD
jgi:hypothetical protein